VPLLGQLVKHTRAGRPLSGLGLGAAGKPELAEQDITKLFRAPGVERLAGECLDFRLERAGALRKFTRQPREHLPIDRNAASFHAREHGHQRSLERLVDRCGMLGGHSRLQDMPESQGHVGMLSGEYRGLVDLNAVEGDTRLS
jgi:hypothetical protein